MHHVSGFSINVFSDQTQQSLELVHRVPREEIIAQYSTLVRRGVPFREAHRLVGQMVALGERRGLQLGELDLDDYQRVSSLFGPDLYAALDFEASVEAHDVVGGTALKAVREQLKRARGVLSG